MSQPINTRFMPVTTDGRSPRKPYHKYVSACLWLERNERSFPQAGFTVERVQKDGYPHYAFVRTAVVS